MVTDKEQYLKELAEIQKKIDRLTISMEYLVRQNLKDSKPYNPPPYDPFPSTICPKCGMEWKGVMGYVCTNQPCPIQPSPSYYSGVYLNEK